ncbi:thiamine phosphate synthase [Sphingobacterium pedocola]|uniref:Thiamine-phosphate synthase n=1 Tax=Sphingobacterium pedocola TaxID=2082722 RepID=A0ABR9TCJ5_9SPHI|nr:thiamine phosphate synthase [Sphingobacterium pedocola]MBE8723080.1 thiamine phosphate synthase [Sphingobacterium pedocola]
MPIHDAFPYPLYLVISERDCTKKHWLTVAEEAILGGVDIIQLREKDCSRHELLQKARELKRLTDRYQIPLIINDAVDIAIEIQAWGVHVGRSDMPPSEIISTYGQHLSVGWSIELMSQMRSEELQHVQHLGISPIFSTATKKDTISTWGITGIRELRNLSPKPFIAIGGMQLANAKKAFDAGANSIAVVSAICASGDPRKASHELKELLK